MNKYAELIEKIGNHVAAEYEDDPHLDRMIVELRAMSAVAAESLAIPADEAPCPGCTGSDDCQAPAHQHGCFADLLGYCNEPSAHAETQIA